MLNLAAGFLLPAVVNGGIVFSLAVLPGFGSAVAGNWFDQ
ncbi:hypothetical protein QFZ49_001045 [Streptomyces turgidiscabies]|uniref:Uncharacterized protein n=1 Tax=Streptomyces turgidiscabies TaxID=85558 RepID=A0ABU0RHD0_9ACTN|nr:hypothetical protein [Streptomyces turgidiscabies]